MPFPWLPVALTGASAIGSYLGGRSRRPRQIAGPQTITQEALLTPEQQRTRSALEQFYQTGRLGGYQAGEAYGGSLGNFNMSDIERGGLGQIYSNLNAGRGSALDTLNLGKQELQNLLSTESIYNPMREGGLYEGYKRQALREGDEAANRLKAQAAFGGRLMSSSTGRELGLLGERTTANLQDIGAQLTDIYAQRRAGAIPMAAQLAGQEQGILGQQAAISQQNIQNAMQYGGLERMLQNAQAQTQYQDWLRQHQELGETVGAAERLAYNPVQWGVRQFTMPAIYEGQENPYQGLLNTMAGTGFNMLGQWYGSQQGQGGGSSGGYGSLYSQNPMMNLYPSYV